jgi:hypothetical protein
MIYIGMRSRILSFIVFLPLTAGCGGSAGDRHDCSADSEALTRMCDAFNSGAGPLQLTISEDYGPSGVHGEISAEGSGAGEDLAVSGHLTIDIDPESDKIFLSAIHIDLSDFIKGVG